jgi:flagellar biogenesis protein FliO
MQGSNPGPAGADPMRIPIVLALGAEPLPGPDLTRYFLVCAATISALVGAAWFFRKYLAGHIKARAAKRSLQVLDVLPLGGKQKLVVVRCYDRSFLLGLGEKEVRSIAELGLESATGELAAAAAPVSEPAAPFARVLERELVPSPSARDLRAGVVA